MHPNRLPKIAFSLLLALSAPLLFAACEDSDGQGDPGAGELDGRNPAQEATAASPAEAVSNASTFPPVLSKSGASCNASTEIDTITWKGKNVSAWPVTTTLRASVSGGMVHLGYGKLHVWPENKGVCATAWAIVNIDGKWYAGTFENLRPGQIDKGAYVLDGSHGDYFKVEPLSSWRPQPGEVFGLMVSGLCRGPYTNVQERSNICMVSWPGR